MEPWPRRSASRPGAPTRPADAFLWPLLVMLKEEWKTLPVGVATFGSVGGAGQTQIQGFGIAMAAVTILALPSLLVFLALQRYFIEGVTKTGLKG